MTYYDANSGEREDRIIVGYDFTDDAVTSINLVCNGEIPSVVIDLGGNPIEIELVTSSVTALSGLIDALYEARTLLEEHQSAHSTGDTHERNNQPLYVPNEWTEDPS
ncbi:hypothetical protein [Streptomyces sp. SID13031]|uniref:hypothetical protein n=1 Tax=Streptomyces sp. SID13031 TaxID=2706046 RepID=UPI0013C9A92A|nr:hypothetical protein [Streptomyces sp. SID13031]NEA37565.1 hypothetical protein [Streptomyces sp. SID13031]